MATIINNQATSAESALRVDNPFMYIPYPDRDGAAGGGQMFFGEPKTDPELDANQKRVYALQEDGSIVPLSQPVNLTAGGIPEYNGSPARIAVDGNYSWKVLDKNGDLLYNSPDTFNKNLSSVGESIIIEDVITLSGTQTSVTFPRADLSMAVVDVTGPLIDSRNLYRDIDYTITSGSTGTIFLNSTFPNGTSIRARQNAFSAQDDDTASGFVLTYKIVSEAAIADIPVDSTVTIMGASSFKDGLSFDRYVVVPGGTGPNDGINFINMSNGNQLQSLKTREKILTYSETVHATSVNSGVLTLDLNKGTAFTTTLSESVSSINFANAQGGAASSVTLNLKQDGTGGRGVSFSGLKAAGGTAPSLTTTANAESKLVFSTADGTNWEVYLAADDLQVVP